MLTQKPQTDTRYLLGHDIADEENPDDINSLVHRVAARILRCQALMQCDFHPVGLKYDISYISCHDLQLLMHSVIEHAQSCKLG